MKTTDMNWIAVIGAAALVACGDTPGSADDARQSAPTGASPDSVIENSSDPPPPQDLITAARGATLVSVSHDERGALALIDGDDESNWNVYKARNTGPYVFVVELMSPAVLTSVGIDGSGPRPGGVVGGSAGRVRVEGSAIGPEEGFRELASIDAAPQGETLASLENSEPVRWLRFTIEQSIEPDAAYIYLDELVAYGTLEPIEEAGRFSGVFRSGRADFIRLEQDGLSISGCYLENSGRTQGTINGSLVDGVALINWRSDQGITGTALLTRNAAGDLGGLRYRQRSRTAWGGPMVPESDNATTCENENAANPVAQSLQQDGVVRIYGIQFEFDSDVPKPSARAALDQLFAALSSDESLVVVIEGHTDAQGSEDYNAALSQRRAEAVVAHLSERGIDPARLTALGMGEAQPVANNDTADGRALNRRVEVRRAD